MRLAPANIQLRRAHLVLMLAGLVPTVAMTATGILLLLAGSSAVGVVAGVLVLAFCTSAVTGYILGSLFLSRGASVARFQNDFLSAVTHELNTPLTSIRMFIDTLGRDQELDPAEKAKCLELLDREIKRLDGLVARLFDLSRMESGRHQFARESVPVDDLFEEVIAAFDAGTLSDPTAVRVDPGEGLVVTGDHASLVQALTNLLFNAWKHTDEPREIALAARADGKWVEVSVTDNGPGISRSEQRQIFDHFERGDAAVRRGTQGAGLGLAIVQAIVRGHRGRLIVASQPDEGSTFTMKLPAWKPES